MAIKEVEKRIIQPRTMLVVLIVVLVVLLLSFVLSLRIKFLLHDELQIDLVPLDASFHITNKEAANVTFKVQNRNFGECQSICAITLRDIGTGEILYNDTRGLSHNEEIFESFRFPAPGHGSGQFLFSFNLNCKNIRSFICPSTEYPRYHTALITVNYDLTEEERAAQSAVLPLLQNWSAKIGRASYLLNESSVLVARIPKNNLDGQNFMVQQQWLEEDLSIKQHFFDEAFEVWNAENYTAALEKVNAAESIHLQEYETHTNSTVFLLRQINDNRAILSNIWQKTPGLLQAARWYANHTTVQNYLLLQEANASAQEVLDAQTVAGNIHTEARLLELASHADGSLESNITYFNKLVDTGYWLQRLTATQLTFAGIQVSPLSTFECPTLVTQSALIAALNQSYLNESLTLLLNASNISVETNASGFATNYCGNTSSSMPAALVSLSKSPIVIPVNISLDVPVVELPFMNISIPEPMCCAFGECQVCCSGCAAYPVLFLHGHSFNDANNPEYTLAYVAEIQQALEDSGYIDAGILDVTSDPSTLEFGEWGKSGKPVTVRASYYYIRDYNLGPYQLHVQQSERIENYALRLHEIIDVLKYRTGSPKVIIVAHSMGGLVARSYMDTFGSNSVDMLITINTPYHGISDNVAKACTLLGASKECDDMTQGSVFLNRLNAKPLPQIPMYVIRSVGCTMGVEIGDGIVTNESAYLEGVVNYEIEGNCTDALNSDLHSNVMIPRLYPEVPELLKKILLEDS